MHIAKTFFEWEQTVPRPWHSKEVAWKAGRLAGIEESKAENQRLRAALEAAPNPYQASSVVKAYTAWHDGPRAEALKEEK